MMRVVSLQSMRRVHVHWRGEDGLGIEQCGNGLIDWSVRAESVV